MRLIIPRGPLVLLVVAAACAPPSQTPPLELSPTELAQVERSETDPEALAECGKLQTAAVRAGRAPIFLASEVNQPAEMLSLWGSLWEHPGGRELPQRELPRRNATALMVAVVDQTGHADRNAIRVIRASDSDFGAAVVNVLRRARYRPAIRAGVAVDQCLVLSWRIAITP